MKMTRKLQIFEGKASELQLDLDGMEQVAAILKEIKSNLSRISGTKRTDPCFNEEIYRASVDTMVHVTRAIEQAVSALRFEVVEDD